MCMSECCIYLVHVILILTTNYCINIGVIQLCINGNKLLCIYNAMNMLFKACFKTFSIPIPGPLNFTIVDIFVSLIYCLALETDINKNFEQLVECQTMTKYGTTFLIQFRWLFR